MSPYISMLRGINVSGQKNILMPDLKDLYERLGFSNVITYIQSGNVIFSTGINSPAFTLSSLIEKAVLENYGFNVPVIIRTIDEMKLVIKESPFIKETGQATGKLYVTTKLSNTFFENKFMVKATTRNWNTVNKLLELATGVKFKVQS